LRLIADGIFRKRPETSPSKACLQLDATKRTLHGFVVMPDHMHLVFTPLADDDGPISLPEILQKVKSESAHRINKLLRRKDESGGRVI
jgi:REP element-mobilizing transposase RayT